MELWVWAVLMLALGVLLLVMDIFVPSGGILAALSAISVVVAVVMGYMHGARTGTVVFIVAGIIFPTIIVLAIQFWPNTPFGRLILVQRPEHPDDVLPDTTEYRSLKTLIGKRGVTQSLMLPSGIVNIDNVSYDAVSEGMAIEKGEPVEVVAVRTNRIVVRQVDTADVIPVEDILSQPIDSLGLDSLDDPRT